LFKGCEGEREREIAANRRIAGFRENKIQNLEITVESRGLKFLLLNYWHFTGFEMG